MLLDALSTIAGAAKLPELSTLKPPVTDMHKSHWVYLQIMEASVDHHHPFI